MADNTVSSNLPQITPLGIENPATAPFAPPLESKFKEAQDKFADYLNGHKGILSLPLPQTSFVYNPADEITKGAIYKDTTQKI